MMYDAELDAQGGYDEDYELPCPLDADEHDAQDAADAAIREELDAELDADPMCPCGIRRSWHGLSPDMFCNETRDPSSPPY